MESSIKPAQSCGGFAVPNRSVATELIRYKRKREEDAKTIRGLENLAYERYLTIARNKVKSDQFIAEQDRVIAQLERENAQLKEQLRVIKTVIDQPPPPT